MRNQTIILTTGILLVAAVLRIIHISDLPPGPHYDEAANIIITRTVAFGGARYFPMVENYQGREVLYYYLSAPFMRLVHDSRFALQLVSLYSNMILVAATMTLGRMMFGGRRGIVIGLAAGIVAAISLPQILLARQAFRAIILPMMQALVLLFLWRGLKRNQRQWLVTGGLIAGAAVYTYNSSRLFPIWLLMAGFALLVFSAGERLKRLRQGLLFFVPLAVVAFPFALYAVQKPDIFFGRLYEVTGGENEVTLLESIGLHARMFFLHGESLLRYNPRGRPYFTLIEGVFLIVGIISAVGTLFPLRLTRVERLQPHRTLSLLGTAFQFEQVRRDSLQRTACVLLLISPLMVLPSVISTSGFPPNHMRSIAMTPLVFIIVGLGYERITSQLQIKWVYWLLIFALVGGGVNTGRDYFTWANRADLYYDTDADLAAAATWMRETLPIDVPVYVAAQDRFHPTVTVFDTPPVRWLGQDTLFLPPDGEERVVIFPRSAPPPENWTDWLSTETDLITSLPVAPDGRNAFEAYQLRGNQPLPPNVSSVEGDITANHVMSLRGSFREIALQNGRVTVVTAWQVNQPPDTDDLTPVVQMEDELGNVIARAESFSVGTDTWEIGETLIQRIPNLRVPAGTPPGIYDLKMTWVARETERYLPYITPDGGQAGVWASVGEIEVINPNVFPSPDDIQPNVTYGEEIITGVTLLGWDEFSREVHPSQGIPLIFHWYANPSDIRHRLMYNLYIKQGGIEQKLEIDAPLLNKQPTDTWVNGQLMTERLEAQLPNDIEPGSYDLMLSIDREKLILGNITVVGVPRVFSAPFVEQEVGQTFGEKISLYGYTLATDAETLQLDLIWQGQAEITQDYTVFVHVIDESGDILQQQDMMPQQNTYPTSLWMAGEYVADSYVLQKPSVTFSIVVGLYLQETGTRLPAENDSNFYKLTGEP